MRIASSFALMGLLIASSSGASPARPLPNPPAAASPSDISYVRYEDPAEHAFTDQVPSGWKVGGRMVRYGPVTIAPFIQAMPADGSIFVQLGDWHIQDFSDIPGWRQGQIYTPGTSVIIVRRLESADQYAHSFSLGFQKLLGCGNPEFAESESVANPTGPSRLPQGKTETRIAHFTCQRDGQRYVGRVMASVQSVRLPMSVGWNVVYEASFIAREDRAAAALAVWDKMRTSFSFEPAWNAKESQIAAAATQPARDALDQTLRQTQEFDQHVINGTITVHDPTTGTRSEIKMGIDPYYFTDGLGHFYNSYDPTPRSGFHPVK